jgi:hypothetical protein
MSSGRWLVSVVLAGVIAVAAPLNAGARTLRFCNLRAALTVGQAEFAGALSLYGDSLDELITYAGPDPDSFTTIKICAREAGPRLCTDKLLMDLLDPNPVSSKGALIGAAVGLFWGRDVESTLGGATIGGLVQNTTALAACNKQRLEVVVPAMQAAGGFRVPNLDAVNGQSVKQFLVDRYRAGRITAEQLDHVGRLIDQITKVARETQ